ncbi:transporter substrate-binding domain-containing protein [Xylophilus rhododendri]|uniref:Transporter substrate-binding domain-containing protein n=1 Tax=Xylophilus rhododendri TaxID=2697032 RepID=A0A857J3P3_9BURK|nr:ABC transporter substrate-binding protein [Xylophilus rhododendri]QHI98550.1 transporter substrate-binding domain-containing protein [Xylophilus rhododendri]
MTRSLSGFLRSGLTVAVAALAFAGTAHADRLKDIQSRGTLVCATLSGSEPLAFQDPATRQYVGFDVDTCAAVAKHLGVKMEHKPVTVEARIPELGLGRVDLVAAALGYTKERAEQIAFTSSHYQIPLKIMVATNSGITKFADLAGKKISANKGSTPELYTRRAIPAAEVVTFQDSPTAFLALSQGKAQGFAIAQASGVRFVNESGGKFKFLDETLAYEATALGVKKGEPELLAAVNKALAEMEASGELDAMWTKWYGPQTKYNIPRDKKLTPISAL